MIRDLALAGLVVGICAPAAGLLFGAAQTPAAPPPQNQTPPAPVSADPSAVVFATGTGMMLHAIKPASVADYEAAIVALQQALSSADDPATREMASGWRVYKAAEPDAKGNAIYVHVLQPVAAGVDYRPSIWLDELLMGAPADLLAKYRDAFAAPPTRLSLTELADMAVAPTPSNASPSQPVNASPPKPINSSPPGPR